MNRSASLFNQLLQQFPRSEFKGFVNKHQTERGAKGFTSWSHFVSMIFPLRGTFGYASLPEQTPSERSVTGLHAVLESSAISVCVKLHQNQLRRMLILIDQQNYFAICFSAHCPRSEPGICRESENRSDSRTS